MDKPELANGQQEGAYRFWPAAHPRFYVEAGEPLEFSLRAKLQNPFAVVGPQSVAPGPDATGGSAQTLPAGSVKVTARPAGRDDGYWLDVKVGPIRETGIFKSPIAIPGDAAELARDVAGQLDVTLTVIDSSVVITPKSIDLGELSIANLDHQASQVGVLNVRKLFGTFSIARVSSCASFLKFDVQPLIKGKNYLLRVRSEPGTGAIPGPVQCQVVIMTDDPRHPKIEVPLKVSLTP